MAAQEALEFAHLDAREIDLIIAVSCTGFMMPSLTAYLINDLGFPSTTKQLLICQLGCVAGASAINRAFEYCKAFPKANVLIACVELSSLCFQPSDETMESLLASALFGDMAAACVKRNADAHVRPTASPFSIIEAVCV